MENVPNSPPFSSLQRGVTAMRHASECLMQGCLEAATSQAGFYQQSMLDVFADLKQLSQAREPEQFFQLEAALTRKQAERVVNAVRLMQDQLRRSYFNAVELAVDGDKITLETAPATVVREKEVSAKSAV